MRPITIFITAILFLNACDNNEQQNSKKVEIRLDSIKFEKLIFFYRNCHWENFCGDIYLQIEKDKTVKMFEKNEYTDTTEAPSLGFYKSTISDSTFNTLIRILNRMGMDTLSSISNRKNSHYILYYNGKRKVFSPRSSAVNDDLFVLIYEKIFFSKFERLNGKFEMETP